MTWRWMTKGIFKCLVSKIPRSAAAIFTLAEDGSIGFADTFKKDPRQADGTSGYVDTSIGDSGIPYWRSKYEETEDNGRQTRNIVVAIHNGRFTDPADKVHAYGSFSDDAVRSCRIRATKVNSEIVTWVK